ncbi:hypothetical protein HDZ31DRAFT_33447 [Schizophyllum fasciatum]
MLEYWELAYTPYGRQWYPGRVKAFMQAPPQYEDELKVEMELWNRSIYRLGKILVEQMMCIMFS